MAEKWQEGLDEMSRAFPTNGREVRLRIYRDYGALRAYQAHGISRLRLGILEPPDDETEIPTED